MEREINCIRRSALATGCQPVPIPVPGATIRLMWLRNPRGAWQVRLGQGRLSPRRAKENVRQEGRFFLFGERDLTWLQPPNRPTANFRIWPGATPLFQVAKLLHHRLCSPCPS